MHAWVSYSDNFLITFRILCRNIELYLELLDHVVARIILCSTIVLHACLLMLQLLVSSVDFLSTILG